MKNKLPEGYVRLKKYSALIEEICKDIDLRGLGFEPGVMFVSEYHSIDLPEWFLSRVYEYINSLKESTRKDES